MSTYRPSSVYSAALTRTHWNREDEGDEEMLAKVKKFLDESSALSELQPLSVE